MGYTQFDSSASIYRYFKLWQAIGLLLIIIVFWFSLTPKPPKILLSFEFADKLWHFLAYFTLMLWHGQLYRTTLSRLMWMLGFIAMGVGIEYLQGLGVARLFEWADAVANSLGAVVAWLLLKTHMASLLLYLEHRLVKR